MARALADIEQEIRALSMGERNQLLKSLISGLDAPADPDAEQAWLKESERRLPQIEAGTATTIPGIAVLREARARLKHQDWVVDSSPSSTAA